MGVALLEKEKRAPQSPRSISEEEFEVWCGEDVKAEYIDGEVIVMPPSSIVHDSGEFALGVLIGLFVKKNKLGWVSASGMVQARLRKGLRRCPDTVFVEKSRMRIVKSTYVEGAPDLVVEVVSPDSVLRDWHEKYREYETAGVREYWIVDQQQQRMEVYHLGKDRRFHALTLRDSKFNSRVLSGFWVKPEWFWGNSDFDYYEMAREIGIIA